MAATAVTARRGGVQRAGMAEVSSGRGRCWCFRAMARGAPSGLPSDGVGCGSGTLADGGEPFGRRAECSGFDFGEQVRKGAGKRRRGSIYDGKIAEVDGRMDGAIGADDEVGGNVPPSFGEIHAESTLRRWRDSGDKVELSGGNGVVGGGLKKRPSDVDALSARYFQKGIEVKARAGAVWEAVGIGSGKG